MEVLYISDVLSQTGRGDSPKVEQVSVVLLEICSIALKTWPAMGWVDLRELLSAFISWPGPQFSYVYPDLPAHSVLNGLLLTFALQHDIWHMQP